MWRYGKRVLLRMESRQILRWNLWKEQGKLRQTVCGVLGLIFCACNETPSCEDIRPEDRRSGGPHSLDAVVTRQLASSTGNGSWVFQASTSFLSHCADSFLPILGTWNWQFFGLYNIPNASSSSVLGHTVGLSGQNISHWLLVCLHGTIQMQIHVLSLGALTFWHRSFTFQF